MHDPINIRFLLKLPTKYSSSSLFTTPYCYNLLRVSAYMGHHQGKIQFTTDAHNTYLCPHKM